MPSADLMERLAPALPARYRLIREIGRGGTSRVYLAQELQPQREVAIKVLEPRIAALVGPERFLREVDFASKLAHPHILPVFAAGEADSLLYYVMPYVPGETLRDRMTRERILPLSESIDIAREVADALSFAHQRDIVHRDIKPENILLQAGHAIVADFGIARAMAAEKNVSLTGAGFVVGTPAYMSPEQASGAEVVDARTDIYSLGCVLYEMLGGAPPHTGDTPESLIIQKLHLPAPPLSLLRPDLPAQLTTTIDVALARQPGDRFPDAAGLRQALDAAHGSRAPRAAPVTVQVRPGAPTPASAAGFISTGSRRLLASLAQRTGLTVLLLLVAAVNWIETTFDNALGATSPAISAARHQIAHAMQWMEGGLSFRLHDVTNSMAAYGYAAVYFFLFPALLAAVAVGLAQRPSITPYRTLTFAVVADYLLSLPFFLFFPVPERWSFPESGAVMLSDRWSSSLIEAARPISALDNCFPSFHVSLTVIALLACFRYRLRFRWTALAVGLTVVLSTLVLGVHWLADIVAGAAAGFISVALAERFERRRSAPALSPTFELRSPARLLIVPLLALGLGAATRAPAQTPAFVTVALDADSRRADEKLRRYLEQSTGLGFIAEQAYDYRNIIDRLTQSEGRGTYVARVTPYALVAAELLGADFQVLATYRGRATDATTYESYFVVSRARFPREPDLAQVLSWLRAAPSAPTFAYHSQFSSSSYFLPAIYFRRNDVFDMPASSERATAIRARQLGSGASDLVRAVAGGQADLAAVWSGTRAAFSRDSLAARYGGRVWFVALGTALPNDLLVASADLDSASVAGIRAAIARMPPNAINEGDYLTWLDINAADEAREALANLRWLARERPAAATVDVRRAEGAADLPEELLVAARQAIRLSGLELVNYDRDFHVQQDYLWTLEEIHDGAVRLSSRIVGAAAADQNFEISFRTVEELTGRIGEIIQTRMHRIRYVWPYRTDPPTVLRDVDFGVAPGTRLEVRKVHWQDPHRHSYLQDAPFNAVVASSDFYKLELSPFVEPPDGEGFGFNPMSNISYRVAVLRSAHERPIFRVLTAALVVLIVLAGVAAGLELRRGNTAGVFNPSA